MGRDLEIFNVEVGESHVTKASKDKWRFVDDQSMMGGKVAAGE